MPRIVINGQSMDAPAESTVLECARNAGIEIPTLCHDPHLKPFGGCRLCIVQIGGNGRPVTSCNTVVRENMTVETNTPEIFGLRQSLLQLLANEYPAEAVEREPDKEFHHWLRAYGVTPPQRTVSRDGLDETHPYIYVNPSQCILCSRCVRICEEVQGQFVWKLWNRGDATCVLPDTGGTLLESTCVSCGACVDTCPTGALEDKSVRSLGAPTHWTRTTCAYCGTGCEMNVGTRDGQIVVIKPVLDAPVSRGHLCVKGRYAYEFVRAHDRVTQPMIRVAGVWKQVSWDEAISFTADALNHIVMQYGADSVGVLGSARATNEENYLAQKFARVVLGTNNVDCCARVCHAPTATAMKLMLGAGAATNSFDDIELAKTILVCGANATENHPIIGARIKEAALRGTRLIVLDPRTIELTRYATLHLRLRPGTNVPLLNAMACAILQEGLHDDGFLSERVAGLTEYRKFVKAWPPERAATVCGVHAKQIREAARIYASQGPAMCIHGLGVTEHTQGTEGVMCLVNLALLTGNIGKRGAGINPLRGQNNVQGSAHMGCDPGSLTGAVSLADGSHLFSKVWRLPIPMQKGLNLLEMLDAAEKGDFRALWAIGYDVFLTNANADFTRRTLERIGLVIVQDMFLNETAREFGNVFLPAASAFEKDGTFMNAERRIQRVRKSIDCVGASRSDWEIICDVAGAMGKGMLFDFSSAEQIWNEIRSVWTAGAGISYERLELGGLQWPCPAENHPGTEVLHVEAFSSDKRASLRRIEFQPTAEAADGDYPFTLITGRTLYQFNAGTMTSRTANSQLRPHDCLDISFEDSERLGLSNGQHVRLSSRYGEAIVPIKIQDSVRPGELFATFHTLVVFLNCVTSPRRDNFIGTPEYKVTAVRLDKIQEAR